MLLWFRYLYLREEIRMINKGSFDIHLFIWKRNIIGQWFDKEFCAFLVFQFCTNIFFIFCLVPKLVRWLVDFLIYQWTIFWKQWTRFCSGTAGESCMTSFISTSAQCDGNYRRKTIPSITPVNWINYLELRLLNSLTPFSSPKFRLTGRINEFNPFTFRVWMF